MADVVGAPPRKRRRLLTAAAAGRPPPVAPWRANQPPPALATISRPPMANATQSIGSLLQSNGSNTYLEKNEGVFIDSENQQSPPNTNIAAGLDDTFIALRIRAGCSRTKKN